MLIMIRPFPSQLPITLPHAAEPLSEATNSLAVTRTEDSLPCLKEPATGPYPGPDEFSSQKIYSFEVQIDIIVCSQVFHRACSLYFFRRNLVCIPYLSVRVVCL
jgi:hypothetical protein